MGIIGKHPLEGKLKRSTVIVARFWLFKQPPTVEQADALAVEEMMGGWERRDMLTLLSDYRDRATKRTAWKDSQSEDE